MTYNVFGGTLNLMKDLEEPAWVLVKGLEWTYVVWYVEDHHHH